jgi:hypothetical protein
MTLKLPFLLKRPQKYNSIKKKKDHGEQEKAEDAQTEGQKKEKDKEESEKKVEKETEGKKETLNEDAEKKEKGTNSDENVLV